MTLRDSPPLARGGLRDQAGAGAHHPLTPARAGRTSTRPTTGPCCRTHPARAGRTRVRTPRTSVPRTHPRSRGEDRPAAWRAVRERDSPPIARGGPPAPTPTPDPEGLTPARAGRTSTSSTQRRRPRTHPRSRGEDLVVRAENAAVLDSPPLARGGPDARARRRDQGGLTPARAGRTASGCSWRVVLRTHPRSRGEDRRCVFASPSEVDSPPLARGGRGHQGRDHVRRGLTPARAGRTTCPPARTSCGRTHPRSRGEDSASGRMTSRTRDSPPLARGGRCRRSSSGRSRRLTPARAGRTARSSPPSRRRRTHPRSRGEDASP